MPHVEASELLPWLVNGTLDETERGPVRDHAERCVTCRRELEELEQLRDSIAAAGESDRASVPDMRRINARIDSLADRRGNRIRTAIAGVTAFFADPWRIGFAVQSLVIVILIAMLLQPAADQPPAYTTLSTPDALPDGEYVRIVVDPALTAGEVDAILEPVNLVLVDGLSPHGVGTLAFATPVDAKERADVIERLGANDAVRFVQAITIGPEP